MFMSHVSLYYIDVDSKLIQIYVILYVLPKEKYL